MGEPRWTGPEGPLDGRREFVVVPGPTRLRKAIGSQSGEIHYLTTVWRHSASVVTIQRSSLFPLADHAGAVVKG